MPTPPDYPQCLRHLLHRRVWQSTLGGVREWLRAPENARAGVFVKPAADAKAFAAIVEPKDGMLDTLLDGMPGVIAKMPASTPVWCSDIVDMVAEHRAYVVDGRVRALCQYRGPKGGGGDGAAAALDTRVVDDAVRTFCASDEGRDLKGCAIDFAVLAVRGGGGAGGGGGDGGGDGGRRFVTCLVEVNDGFSLGRYDGLSGKDYTDLLIARWEHLMKT
eukprot:TRINITY_DN2246_c0_g1_i15.p2 TRINITY_DN2246_c0_g1~~TRINITY_DN2246_c0_g1_i15.p2  ORF type:complete len:218 (-),score=91.13 TRINITY_DN2246_c0_g1_i15:74-727(-)